MTRMLAVLLLVLCSCSALYAQTGNASLTGRVTDQSRGLVAAARVTVTNIGTNDKRSTVTSNDGNYSVNALPPGNYKIEIEKPGFENIVKPNLVLHTEDAVEINFELQVGSSSQTITVTDRAGEIDTSPAVSMTVTREFVENMPLNGRSFQDLIQLAPGTVSAGNTSGYYSIDGQRQDANNFTVDGVSANIGTGGGSAGSDFGLSGNSPAQTVLGTTQSLASIDALQEFTIQTSGYTAEFGRYPGGQISLTTRSGTNDFHGALFEYFRNTAFDANSYQNDYYGYPKTAEHQNDFGGALGGPLVIPKLYDGKDKTFFFFSYERLQLLTPAFESEYVPTPAFRQWASPSTQPYLNAAPLPNLNSPGNQDGCTIPDPSTGLPTACDALFTYGYSNPSRLYNIGIRLDQSLGARAHFFFRYANTPSSSTNGAESYSTSSVNTQTWTAGATANISSTLLNDFRFNYSSVVAKGVSNLRSVGGSTPTPRDLLIPPNYDGPYSFSDYYLSIPSSSLFYEYQLGGSGATQHQEQVVDALNWIRGSHNLKFGADWRRLAPTRIVQPYGSSISVYSLSDIQQGYATQVTTFATAPGQPIFHNLSLYAQDHWKVTRKLTIDYGLRWEFNPPPGPSNGYYPAVLTSNDLATATIAPAGTAPYKTSYDHFAPRFGFAWNAISSAQHALTVRGGFGIFYDTGQSTIGYAYSGAYPFSATGPTQNEVPLPFSVGALAPPSLNAPLTPPYPFIQEITSRDLTLPYVEQWNLSIDEALNSRNTLTASYVGNEGKKLLFTGQYQSGPGVPINSDFTNLSFTYNGSSSNYNALQLQEHGRIAEGLDLVASFTWAHSLDNASSNLGGSFPSPLYGNSDNDLRRVLNLALNYQVPTAGSNSWERALTHGWLVSNRFSAQSGYPLNVYQDTFVPLPNGTVQSYLPDLVPGVPIYLHGSAADLDGQPVPGNWRLNSEAFALVPADPTTGVPIRQGTLGRNFLRGPGFYALNTAVQRTFTIHEQLNLNFRVEAFNILNHPNLDFPDTYLPDSTFGQLGLNGVRTIGVSNQLYAMGAARSLQLSLKLQF